MNDVIAIHDSTFLIPWLSWLIFSSLYIFFVVSAKIKISCGITDSRRWHPGSHRQHRQGISALLTRDERSRSPWWEVRQCDWVTVSYTALLLLFFFMLMNKLHFFFLISQEYSDAKLSLHNESLRLCQENISRGACALPVGVVISVISGSFFFYSSSSRGLRGSEFILHSDPRPDQTSLSNLKLQSKFVLTTELPIDVGCVLFQKESRSLNKASLQASGRNYSIKA